MLVRNLSQKYFLSSTTGSLGRKKGGKKSLELVQRLSGGSFHPSGGKYMKKYKTNPPQKIQMRRKYSDVKLILEKSSYWNNNIPKNIHHPSNSRENSIKTISVSKVSSFVQTYSISNSLKWKFLEGGEHRITILSKNTKIQYHSFVEYPTCNI